MTEYGRSQERDIRIWRVWRVWRATGVISARTAVISTTALVASLCLALVTPASASESPMHAGMLAHALDRLACTARVLYVAAHPDDENTRLLAYLANGRHVTAAYLSMTRGGGGQNLIGREQDELLDVIRTHELLAARQLDGAWQRFTRMRDFGYSKSAQETLDLWGHDLALADVVWVIRTFQPDVIITRFSEKPPNHGHHTASAILAREAFEAAADPQRFSEQIALGAQVWQAERLLLNVSTWNNAPPPQEALAMDVGGYDPRLGMSYGELAAISRSQHKSQGFGVPGERGVLIERFLSVMGNKPKTDILEGVVLGWQRFGERAAPVVKALDEARKGLLRDTPEQAIPALLLAHTALDTLPDVPRVRDARANLERIIAKAAGLFLRATAARAGAVPASRVPLEVEVVMRRPANMTLVRLIFPDNAKIELNSPFTPNEKKQVAHELLLPEGARISTPYWVTTTTATTTATAVATTQSVSQKQVRGRSIVSDMRLVGEPIGPPALSVTAELSLAGRLLRLEVPVEYAWTDQVHGERIRPVLIVPPATVTPSRVAVLIPNQRPAVVSVRVRAGRDALSGSASLRLAAGFRSVPVSVPVTLAKAGDEIAIDFTVSAPVGAGPADVEAGIDVEGRWWAYREDVIDYSHIPLQGVLQPAVVRLTPVSLRVPKGVIGYVQGSGDTVQADLAHVGVVTETLSDETLQSGDLSRFSAIILGIRAYNTRAVLRPTHERLMRYVEGGGTVVVQYNTNSRLSPLESPVGPYPLQIGRSRITDERAPMTMLDPKHAVFSSPNRIEAQDFEGWVQERGLYFAEAWDARYTPLLSAADPGEEPLEGGLVLAKYGRGRYVYTGLAFFRQLPAGVPGAYRMFANLLNGK